MRKGHIWEKTTVTNTGSLSWVGSALKSCINRKGQLLKPFLLQTHTTKFGYSEGNSRCSYLHMCYVMCAFLKQWLLQDTPIQTQTKQLWQSKPNHNLLFLARQYKQNNNKNTTTKNYNSDSGCRERVPRNINVEVKKTLSKNNAENQSYNHSNNYHIKDL